MFQNKIFSYKISYCLGVPESALASTFGQIHLTAMRIRYWSNCPVAKEYRATSRVYFMLIRKYDIFSEAKSLKAPDDINRWGGYLEGVKYDFEGIFQRSVNLDTCINTFGGHMNELLPRLYKELKYEMDMMHFMRLLQVPELSPTRIQEVRFALKRETPAYNIHFFGSEILNICLSDMIKSDVSIRRRLSIIFGEMIPQSNDNSNLANELRIAVSEARMAPSELTRFKTIIIDDMSVADDRLFACIERFTEQGCKVIHCQGVIPTVEAVPEGSAPENTVLVTHWEADTLQKYVGVTKNATVAVTMHIPRLTYKQILSRAYPNTVLLSSQRELM